MRLFTSCILAVFSMALIGCGGSGGNGGQTKAVGGPSAVPAPGPMPFINFVGASRDNNGVSSTVDSGGAIITTSQSGGGKSIKLTLLAPVDLSYADLLFASLVPEPVFNGVYDSFNISIYEGNIKHTCEFWDNSPLMRLHGIPRADRDAVTAIEMAWVAPFGESKLTIGGVYYPGVWLSLNTNADPSGLQPPFEPLTYQTTYYNSTSGAESGMSPGTVVPSSNQARMGMRMQLTTETTDLPGFDRVRFYRAVTEGSVTTRYRLGEVANAGTPTLIDRWPLDVVKTFPPYDP